MRREAVRGGRMSRMNPHDSESRWTIAALAAVCVLAGAGAVWLVRTNGPARVQSPSLTPAPPAPAPVAQIVRVPAINLAVINLGLGDQLEQGMTFDVYDKQTGVPAPSGNASPPPPKASIEVVRIGPGFSECRVIRRTPGTPLVEGDLVVHRAAGGRRAAIAHPTNP